MKYSDEVWAEKRKAGLTRYLLFDGILISGGPVCGCYAGRWIFFCFGTRAKLLANILARRGRG